ncbi:UbiD family decarboxylase [Streptomyces sp. AV19]|uniref:UbiD family decarboxylase n=1 Tax=Streptomyces sp. AV19 TaxID=2793068 RepID=UPI0018FEB472|nr:UbiD family decarboxylase [Streptomyces sp. AV19]MBH1937579.1 UbiD family decarboxylase [Streptomyces sp. AV19]MDG4533594.1 UbiD family decarboxylase [Streptomyces sp. AV19]
MTRHLKSLRDYLDVLRERGDLQEVKREVSTDLEMGAIIRHASETCAPAPLFTNIRDHEGYRLLGAPFSYSSDRDARMARIAIGLGLAPETTGLEIVDALLEHWDAEPVPPVVVDDAPCQQNVLTGDDVDLTKFPVPMIHKGDGGRFLGTLGIFVYRTPDRSWTNWSIARAMLIDRNRFTAALPHGQHNRMVAEQWDAGTPVPFALVQGAEPAAVISGGSPLPQGTSEAGFLGSLFGEPLETVRCKTVDLEVPATAEIVIEGHVDLGGRWGEGEMWPEGPMGEFHGYMHGGPSPCPLFHVTAVTHRDNPILPVCNAGKPVDETHSITSPGISASCLRELRNNGIPVTRVWMPPESAMHLLVVTVPNDWAQRSGLGGDDLCRKIGTLCKGTHGSLWYSQVMVFEDDVDPTDLRDILWAFTTRCHPTESTLILENQGVGPIDPLYFRAGVPEKTGGRGPVAVHNCLLADREGDISPASFADNYPAELRRSVLARWGEHSG